MELHNANFINISHTVNNTRIYKYKSMLYCYTATRNEIIPFSTKSIYDMAEHIVKQISGTPSQANLMFGYAIGSLTKNKQKQLNMLLSETDQDVNQKQIIRWVMMLV